MSAIRLLAAPVDPAPATGAHAESMALVPASRRAPGALTIQRSDTAYPGDGAVWTASAGSDGSFTFYAVPQKNSGSGGTSSQWDGFSSAQLSGYGWYTRNAAAQYALQSHAPSQMFGQLINIYV